MDIIPWPIAYGVGGGSLVVLVMFGIWFLRQLARGYDAEGKRHGLVPGSAVASLLASERKRADDLIALYALRDKEKDETIRVEREGRTEAVAALHKSVESNKITDDFYMKTKVVER